MTKAQVLSNKLDSSFCDSAHSTQTHTGISESQNLATSSNDEHGAMKHNENIDNPLAAAATYGNHEVVSSALTLSEKSFLFHPLHCIGGVTDGASLLLFSLGGFPYLVASFGTQYYVYETANLRVAFRSPTLPLPYIAELPIIQAIAVDIKNEVTNNQISVWDTSSAAEESEISISAHPSKNVCGTSSVCFFPLTADSEITVVFHPDTYVNKILIAYADGTVEIWNFRTLKRIHVLSCLKVAASSRLQQKIARKNPMQIVCVAKGSHPDIVAFGHHSGRICVVDLRKDEVLLEFFHSLDLGEVTALAFSSEPSHSKTYSKLVSGSANGSFVVWDLEKGLMHSSYLAHRCPVSFLSFVPGQSTMISAAADNAILMWIFDSADGSCRILKSRRGPVEPICRMAFYDEFQLNFITSCNSRGTGNLGVISPLTQQQNYNFSQKSLSKNTLQKSLVPVSILPPIEGMAFAHSRHYDWPNVVTCHTGQHEVNVWSGHDKDLVPTILKVTGITVPATAVAVSACGNFVIVGYENGAIRRFNLQSGVHRGTYISEDSKCNGKAHLSSICKVEILGSQTVLSACSHPEDLQVLLWDLSKHTPTGSIRLHENGHGIATFKIGGALIAVVLQNGALFLCDIAAGRIVREFSCGSPVNDLCFSRDYRWLIVATEKCELLTFDIFSSCVIDWVVFPSPVLCVEYDPSGTFLYTSHQHLKGILTWSCKHIFDDPLPQPLLNRIPSKPIQLDLGFNVVENEALCRKNEMFSFDSELPFQHVSSKFPLFRGALTLSGLSIGKIRAIRYLNQIKKKSEPTKPPEPPEKAPFFLSTHSVGSGMKFISNVEEAKQTGMPVSDIAEFGDNEFVTEQSQLSTKKKRHFLERGKDLVFAKSNLQRLLLLENGERDQSYHEIMTYFLSLSPSGVHLALSEIGELAGGNEDEVIEMLRCFVFLIEQRFHIDLLQACLEVFLELHGDILAQRNNSHEAEHLLSRVHRAISNDWKSLDMQFNQLSCYLKFLSHIQIE